MIKNASILTPHRLSVGVLIMQISKFRHKDAQIATNERAHRTCVRNSCLLLLNLIQSPDLTFSGLCKQTPSIQNAEIEEEFINLLQKIAAGNLDVLLDVVDMIKQFLLPDNNLLTTRAEFIARNSVIGLYLRRLILHFDQLAFSEIITFFEKFKEYVIVKSNKSSDSNDEVSLFEKHDDGSVAKEWTKRQAELFIATQSALITTNKQKALKPIELHENIKGLLKSNPNLPSAHFLNYLNYMRVKEFCGAIDSLYHCFDKSSCNGEKANGADERSRNYRYAVLNLAILHYQFGNKSLAMTALKEAIRIAQETNDNVCLQHAHAWLYCLASFNRNKLMQHSIVKSLDLNMSHVMSLGIQAYVQYAALSTGNPKQVFVSLTRSDIINCQHNQGHNDLVATSYMQKAAIWLFYGKTEMASLWSQLLVFSTSHHLGHGTENAENLANCCDSYALALTNLASIFHLDAEYNIRNSIMNFIKEKFPQSSTWMLCNSIFSFQRLLYNCQFTEAQLAASRVSVLDKYEGSLCKSQLHLHTGDYKEAYREVNQILNLCKENEAEVRMDIQVRAMIMLADVQIATCLPAASPAGVLGLLNSSLAYANDYNMQHLASLAHLRIAHVLLLMGMSSQAAAILERCLVQILAHGGVYDCAQALLLQAMCGVANSVNFAEKERQQQLQTLAGDLDNVKGLFEKTEAFFRVKDVLLLQAKIYHELGLKKQRNTCAMEFHNLDQEHPNTIPPTIFRII